MSDAVVEYVGRDLEAMDIAENYHEWIWQMFLPYVGTDVVEVGAGSGSFSKLILTSQPRTLSLVEPSAMFDLLKSVLAGHGADSELRFFNSTFCASADAIASRSRPDTVVYVNVLEHVEDDEGELRKVYETLRPGGHLCIFVPAMPTLYSRYDKYLGHFRRYKLGELKSKCESAGFKISLARRMDLPGVLPWLLKYRIMGSMNMEPWAVRLYDRAIVPIAKTVEGVFPPPIGKNVLVVAKK